MKKVLYILLAGIFIVSCSKDDTQDRIDQDDQLIRDYLEANNLSYTKDDTGVYYLITKEGSGGHPTLNHTVVVDYKGYLMNGDVFDQSTNAIEMHMGAVINGFQIAVNKLKPGGKGTFILPSQLGYGDKQVGSIPPNSILIFDIELVEYY